MGIDYSARMEDGLLVVTSVGFDENIEQVLGPAYRGMQQAALAAAFEGDG